MPNLARDPHLIQADADKMDSQNKSSYLRARFVPSLIPSVTRAGVKISFNPQQLCEKWCICYPLIYGETGKDASISKFTESETSPRWVQSQRSPAAYQAVNTQWTLIHILKKSDKLLSCLVFVI